MELFNTLPMPEGFGKQVETPQGWRFRHCATFFTGNMCPDCHKVGFVDAANQINETVPPTDEVTGEVTGEVKVPENSEIADTAKLEQGADNLLSLQDTGTEAPGTEQEGTQEASNDLEGGVAEPGEPLAPETADAPPADDAAPPAAPVNAAAAVLGGKQSRRQARP